MDNPEEFRANLEMLKKLTDEEVEFLAKRLAKRFEKIETGEIRPTETDKRLISLFQGKGDED